MVGAILVGNLWLSMLCGNNNWNSNQWVGGGRAKLSFELSSNYLNYLLIS